MQLPPETGKVKYASAHDLRRAFAERWAALIMPAHLQQLMRHESIETTLRYYVGANAERTADVCMLGGLRAARGVPVAAANHGSSGGPSPPMKINKNINT